MKRPGYLYIACLIAIMSCPAWADLFEYSDAVGYGSAQHVTGEWQRLGDLWDSESGPLAIDTSDDGVSWSTDGGGTFGGDLIKGEEVTFYFDMRRAPYGRHDIDQIKVWVDWNGDLQFDNNPSNGEMILYDTWDKGSTQIADNDWKSANGYPNSYVYNYPSNPPADLQKTFTATLTVPDNAVLGTTWLRARVSCDHVLLDSPYGELWQGEVEDWQLNIVPVPSGIILAGIGMVVAQWRLKKKKFS
ncbi:MAG: hypothetical protein GY845_01175 [Planctomycetes bacterium]|nr:hypothetical protein [Planctomycetota bacterium]